MNKVPSVQGAIMTLSDIWRWFLWKKLSIHEQQEAKGSNKRLNEFMPIKNWQIKVPCLNNNCLRRNSRTRRHTFSYDSALQQGNKGGVRDARGFLKKKTPPYFRVPGLIRTALSAHPLLHGPISAQITSCPAVAANQSSAAPPSHTSLFML